MRGTLENVDLSHLPVYVLDEDGLSIYATYMAIVIDYDAPVNEQKVDEADLAALVEQGKPAACSCTDKCHAGAVNTSCPLCAVNMTECAGKEPEPSVPAESEQPNTDPEPEKESGNNGLLVIVLALALAGGQRGRIMDVWSSPVSGLLHIKSTSF